MVSSDDVAPAQTVRLSKIDLAIAAALSAVALFVFARVNTDIDVDDAYISYRYMENLVRHGEAVYNLGDRVYGSTAMLWVFLISLVCRVSGSSAEHAANIIAAALTAANVGLLYSLVRLLRGSALLAIVTVGAFLSFPLFTLVSTLGMETAFLTTLILLCFHAFARDRFASAGLVAGLSFMTRPDALAILLAMLAVVGVGVLRVEQRARSLRNALRLIAGFCVVVAPFLMFCGYYYGVFLPNTLSAKRAIVLVVGTRWWMIEHFVDGPGVPVTFALLWGAGWAVARRRIDGVLRTPAQRLFAVAVLWLLAYAAAWTWTGIDKYIWYVAAMAAPSVIALTTSALIARRGALMAVVSVLAVFAIGVWWGREADKTIWYWNKSYIEEQELRRRALGTAINLYTEPSREVLTTGAIGIVGYTCMKCFVVDVVGLVTPRDRKDSYPPATLMYTSDETAIPPGYRAVYWSRQPVSGGAGSLLLASLNHPSTWNVERSRPSIWLDLSPIPELTLLGINPLRSAAAGGQVIQFEAVWKFDRPITDEMRITYSISTGEEGPVSVLEATAFLGGRRSFQSVGAGEAVIDSVSLEIPRGTPSGSYSLSMAVSVGAGTAMTKPTTLMNVVVR